MELQPSIAQLLDWAYQQLAGGESPKLDARILLSHCLDKDISYLITWPEKIPDGKVVEQFKQFVTKRQSGYPIAYLVGFRGFWTLQLQVSEHTLIPRPETELLVETALTLTLPEKAKVLDLGTGTGAIALSLASERANWLISGVDCIAEAVVLAQSNAKLNQITTVDFYQSDWFSQVDDANFDLIVSNPPYVEAQSEYLSKGDVKFEPLSALTSGTDGLDDIKQIVNAASHYLKTGGYLLLEHGFNQSEKIARLLKQHKFTEIEHRHDLNGLLRVSLGKLA